MDIVCAEIHQGYFSGIDHSMNSTGLIILDIDNNIIVQKNITSNVKLSDEERIKNIGDEILSELLKFPKIECCIEGISYASTGRGVVQQASLHCYICILLLKYDIKYVKCPPNSLKKFVTGKGQCKKDLMMLKTFQKWNVEFPNSDLCDAYGLARYVKEN